jgi:nucleoside-diphosphate-sugar epimerase
MSETSTLVGGKPLILLPGATGYVGGRVLKALEQAGHHVRCLAPPGISALRGANQRLCRRCVDQDAPRGDEGCRRPTISSTPWAQGSL